MNAIYIRLSFIVIAGLLLFPNTLMGYPTLPQNSAATFQKKILKDSLTIDILISQLTDIKERQKVKIVKNLQKFNFSFFSDKHKNLLNSYLINEKTPSKELILLIGFLMMEKTLEDLAVQQKENKP